MKDREKLTDMYNATSIQYADGAVENYQVWLERQLLARLKALDLLSEVWIELRGNQGLFVLAAEKNCRVKFDDGSVCFFYDKHPFAVLTHFQFDLR